MIWDAEDPKNDYIRFDMGNVTAQAYVEVDALERRVQKKTGITDLAVLGTPSAGGNSANRTATGVSSVRAPLVESVLITPSRTQKINFSCLPSTYYIR